LNPAECDRAVAVLRAGGLLGLPTETVYGLAADASNPAAVAKIFAAKGRPADHPVIVHLADASEISEWAIDIPAAAWTLAGKFWPGPMTLILKRAAHVLDAVTGGQDTVGLRVPSHPAARAVLTAFAAATKKAAAARKPAGLAAPSANKFGHVSPTTAQHVKDEFGDALDLVLDGGACEVGIESTIIDLSAGAPRILRPGFITADAVKLALAAGISHSTGEEPLAPTVFGNAKKKTVSAKLQDAPRVSGSLDAHYAPRTPAQIATGAELNDVLAAHAGKRIAVLSFNAARTPGTLHWRASQTPKVYAHNLYAHLRAMDVSGCELIVIEAPPEGDAWDGINDRLRRAATGSGATPAAPAAPL
jgi:L-threonylcarbamoyladenylate synthase